ncbi:hypothetical protein HY57_01570 [Dyella japonica A8]|uniref:Peptidase A2 domain-containing protein n=1 Tax=Dyella japonica A8 TaxID=1217721 RepID=A0A075JWX1_9GAMM|nr:hypothetical protein HY57_01570 [Dyella japonica A8]
MGLLLAGQAWGEGCHLKSYGTLPVEMVGNQATTMVKINGTSTRFVIDTGAFFNIMSGANASSLGLKLEAAPFGYRISGVGGSANIQQAHVKELGILDTTLKNVDFIVGGTDIGTGLLGANLLDIADLELDLAHGKITLFKAEHCDKTMLAYWVQDGKYNDAEIEPSANRYDRRTFLTVTINGKKVKAVLDSGAAATVLSRNAAERAGIDLKDARAGSTSIGVGAKPVKTWTAKVDSFSVGSETIQHSQMMVLDDRIGDDVDLLLGVDFILAHRMFIANSTKRVFFTYNGGRVFTYADAPADGAKPDGDHATGGSGTASKTAGDYALSGQAHLSRGEPNAAVADLDEAIRLAPDQAAYYVSRAAAHEANKQPDAALADADKALGLDPKDFDALLLRARLRYLRKDHDGAAADVAAASALAPAGSAHARSIAGFYIQLDQPAAALPLLDDWIRLHGSDAMLGAVLNERCWARGLSNQMLDDGLKDCRKAIKRDGANAAYLDSLGLIQLRLGNYADSIKAYEQAVAERPHAAWSRYGLGLAKIRAGQADAGQADLAAARGMDPEIEAHATKFGLAVASH